MTQISLVGLSIIEQVQGLAQQIASLPDPEAIEVLNLIRLSLHEVSPFRNHPVDCVQWVPSHEVEGNTYNPNKVPPPEMKLLAKSIRDNGYAMPIVVIDEKDIDGEDGEASPNKNIKRIVDGFHRGEIGKNDKAVRKQTRGYLPICYIRPGRWALTDRMAATIQFNVHGEAAIEGLSDMVLRLTRKGWSHERIAKEFGKEPDFVLRLMQQVGLAEVWKDGTFRQAWEMIELLPLSKMSKQSVDALILYAEWEENSFIVTQIAMDLYHLSINGKEVRVSDEKLYFVSVKEVEEGIQRQVPSYQIGLSIWYEYQGNDEGGDGSLVEERRDAR